LHISIFPQQPLPNNFLSFSRDLNYLAGSFCNSYFPISAYKIIIFVFHYLRKIIFRSVFIRHTCTFTKVVFTMRIDTSSSIFKGIYLGSLTISLIGISLEAIFFYLIGIPFIIESGLEECNCISIKYRNLGLQECVHYNYLEDYHPKFLCFEV